MIVGNGLIASSFIKHDNDDVIIFASGVSNSLETNQDKFDREIDLLKSYMNIRDKKLIKIILHHMLSIKYMWKI